MNVEDRIELETRRRIARVQKILGRLAAEALSRVVTHDSATVEPIALDLQARLEAARGRRDWATAQALAKSLLSVQIEKATYHPLSRPTGLGELTLIDLLEYFADLMAAPDPEATLAAARDLDSMDPQVYEVLVSTRRWLDGTTDLMKDGEDAEEPDDWDDDA